MEWRGTVTRIGRIFTGGRRDLEFLIFEFRFWIGKRGLTTDGTDDTDGKKWSGGVRESRRGIDGLVD